MKLRSNFGRVAFAAGALAMALLLMSAAVSAQDRWVRVESSNKEISFALPEKFLVNVRRDQYAERKTLWAFEGGVNFEVSVSDQLDAKGNIDRIMVEENRKPSVMTFEAEKLRGKSVTYSDHGYQHEIYLASNKGYYVLKVDSARADNAMVGRFLRSIRANGKPIIEGTAAAAETEATTVSLKSLKTSPEVDAVLDAKPGKRDRAVKFEPLASYSPCKRDLSVRPAFIVLKPPPDLSRPPQAMKSGDIKINAQLLASGEVGDIVVYSDLDRSVLRSWAEAAAKMRFIPADNNGTPVDWCETTGGGFGVSRSTVIISTPR